MLISSHCVLKTIYLQPQWKYRSHLFPPVAQRSQLSFIQTLNCGFSCVALSSLSPPGTWNVWMSINRERAAPRFAKRSWSHTHRWDPVLGCSLPTTQLCPGLALLFLCNRVLFTALPGHSPCDRCVNPCHCMPVFHRLSLCVSVLPSLSVFSLSLCLSSPCVCAFLHGRGP